MAQRLWPWIAAIASGLLCAACFPPFNQVWLCWIALTPLIIAIWFSPRNPKRPWLRDLLLGYVAGVVFFRPRLAGLARWNSIRTFLAARSAVAPFDLPRNAFRILGLHHWTNPADQFCELGTEFAGGIFWARAPGSRMSGHADGSLAGSVGTDLASHCMEIGRSSRSPNSPV